MEGLEAESAVFSVPKDLKVACKVRYEAVIFSDLALKVRRIGHFAWYSNHTMSQWVKLRGEFAAYSFVSQQMALYLCIAV